MNRFLLCPFLIFLCLFSYGQSPPDHGLDWAFSVGTSSDTRSAETISVDSHGNIYISGWFKGTVDFDPGEEVDELTSTDPPLNAPKQRNTFVQKVDEFGNHLWVSHFAGYNNEAVSHVSDDAGNVYITGYFFDLVDFDPDPENIENKNSVNKQSIYLVKLGLSGELLWIRHMTGSEEEEPSSLTLDKTGNVLLAGWFESEDFAPRFPGISLSMGTNGAKDFFLLKLNSDGDFAWINSWGDSLDDVAWSVEVDPGDNIYLTGEFKDEVDFDPGDGVTSLKANNTGNSFPSDVFVLKLNSGGNFQWAKSIGGESTDVGKSIRLDNAQNIHITGGFRGEADFDPGNGVTNLSSAGSAQDIFVLKLDASGDFVWATKFGTSDIQYGTSLSLDTHSNVYVVYDDTKSFGEYVGIRKFDSSGNEVWDKSLEELRHKDIAIDHSNNIYTTGTFRGTKDFDFGPGEFQLSSGGIPSIFVQKLGPCSDLKADIAELPELNAECSLTSLSPPTASNICGSFTGSHNITLPVTAQGTTVITWTYDDGFGNTLIQTQHLVIDDVTAPVPDRLSLEDLTSECEVGRVYAPTATDECVGAIIGTTDTEFPVSSDRTITWTFDDGNGNTSIQTQNIVITDSDPPVPDAEVLADLLGECEVETPRLPTATDNCAGTVIGTTDTVFPVSSDITITWTFDDGNGNLSTQTQNMVITDSDPPVPDAPVLADLTGECMVGMPAAPTATDNCSGVVTGTTDAVFPITTQGTTVITWTYDDGNNNTIRQTQKLMVDDVTVPTLDVPTLNPLTGECEVGMPTAPTATDNCSGVITGTTDAIFPITTQGTTVITWTYDDGNENIITQTQEVVIDDITASIPDVLVLPNLTGECEVGTPTAPTATDNCSGMIIGTTDAIFPITTQGTTVITWTYDDGNENIITQTQEVVIDDVTAPIPDVLMLNPLTGECEVGMPTAPTAIDNCSGMITGTTDAIFPITTQGITVITWTYDDGLGNKSTQPQEVMIDDVTAPMPDVPVLTTLTGECEVGMPAIPTATDNCSGMITGTTGTVFPITSQGPTQITWIFDDGNGNISTQNQNVVIQDVTNPVPDIPALADFAMECIVVSTEPIPLVVPASPPATDNCSGQIIGTKDIKFPITSLGTTVITWSYDDGNGNISTQTQNVVVSDNNPPVPDAATLTDLKDECAIETPTAPTTTDHCIGVITGTTDTVFPITTPGTTVITWSYDDGNGNITTQTQNAIVTPIEASVEAVGNELRASAAGYAYQWLDCNDNILTGETNQVFNPSQSGSYKVEISNGDCSVFSMCVDVVIVGINSEVDTGPKMYPNPANNSFRIVTETESNVLLEIFNNSGRMVHKQLLLDRETLIDVGFLSSGIYSCRLTYGKTTTMKKLLIN